jgi:hypothetical protein
MIQSAQPPKYPARSASANAKTVQMNAEPIPI